MAYSVAHRSATIATSLMGAAADQTISMVAPCAHPQKVTPVLRLIQYLGVLDHSGRIQQEYSVTLGAVDAARGESQVAGVDGAECGDEWRVERRSR
jgi:hypothetical protein